MRHISKDLTKIPPDLISTDALTDMELIAKGDKSKISDKIYKGAYKDENGKLQSRVREELNKYYKFKCAYCEMHCKGEIEHYRPKLGVTGEPSHNGYYWLCYEWSNLVPSCRYCNTEGGKGNQFPIIDTAKRVNGPTFNNSKLDITECNASSTTLLEEKPYLLHPEIDVHPEVFLSFKISDGKEGIEIVGIDKPKRGEKTIEICNLNRPYLKLNRLETVYYNYKQKINLIFDLVADNSIEISNIGNCLKSIFRSFEVESKNDVLTHTLLRKFVISDISNFKNHFAPYIDSDEQRFIVIEAFQNYKSGTL